MISIGYVAATRRLATIDAESPGTATTTPVLLGLAFHGSLECRSPKPRRQMAVRVFLRAIIAAASILLGGAGLSSAEDGQASATPIGKVVSAKGSVTIEHVNAVIVQAALGSQTGFAKAGDPIFLGDIVQTGRDGSVGISFKDDTALNMSSNARMVMSKYVYDPNSNKNSTWLNLTKGTFTFVAGAIAKTGDMKIDTPVATMGIRGTTPRVEILENGTVKFSTLIETGKKKISQKTDPLRKAERPSQKKAEWASRNKAERLSLNSAPLPKAEKLNLSICKGC